MRCEDCNTILEDAGHLGLYCPDKDCGLESMRKHAIVFKKMQKEKAIEEAIRGRI